MPAIYGTEMGSLIQGQIGAWWSISTTFMYILKFQNKMFKRVSCSIGCFVTDFFFLIIKLLVGWYKRFTGHPWSYLKTRTRHTGERKTDGTCTGMVVKASYKRYMETERESCSGHWMILMIQWLVMIVNLGVIYRIGFI